MVEALNLGSIPFCGHITFCVVPVRARMIYKMPWYVLSCLWDGAWIDRELERDIYIEIDTYIHT